MSKTQILFLSAILFAVSQGQGIPNSCGIQKIMDSTTLLTQTIKSTPFPSTDEGFFATVCQFYQTYLDYVDMFSEICHDQFLDALRTVARVGGFYHRLAGRCPVTHPLRPDSAAIDSSHVYEVTDADRNSCQNRLRGDDNCVKNWVNGIKDGTNTCDIFRSGIVCHRNWHESNCVNRGSNSAITKARDDLNWALGILMPLQPKEEACENMTP